MNRLTIEEGATVLSGKKICDAEGTSSGHIDMNANASQEANDMDGNVVPKSINEARSFYVAECTPTCDPNINMIMKPLLGDKEVVPTSILNEGNNEDKVADHVAENICPSFQIGYCKSTSKKPHKFKRRPRANDTSNTSRPGTDLTTSASLCVEKDSAGKRKCDDMDVDMNE